MTGANPHILTGGSAPHNGGGLTSCILSDFPNESAEGSPSSFFFDWYQATVPAHHELLIGKLLERLPEGVTRCIGPGRNSYKFSDHLFSGDGENLATVYHGGHNPHPNVKASGGDGHCRHGDVLARSLRAEFPAHRVSRCDVATDRRGECLYDEMKTALLGVYHQQRSLGRKLSDKAVEPTDRDAGWTYYLGSGFPHKVRLYEKGKERFAQTGDPFWLDYFDVVRLELQVRPEKTGKSVAATMEPVQFWGAAEWLRQAAQGALAMSAEPIMLKAPRVPDHERAYRAMIAQYGPTMLRQIELLGSPEAFTFDLLRRLGVAGEESPQAA